MEKYPAVSIMVKFGAVIAGLIAAAPVALALWAVLGFGAPPVWIVVAVAVGGLGGLLMKTLTELTVIITDMLLPQ